MSNRQPRPSKNLILPLQRWMVGELRHNHMARQACDRDALVDQLGRHRFLEQCFALAAGPISAHVLFDASSAVRWGPGFTTARVTHSADDHSTRRFILSQMIRAYIGGAWACPSTCSVIMSCHRNVQQKHCGGLSSHLFSRVGRFDTTARREACKPDFLTPKPQRFRG